MILNCGADSVVVPVPPSVNNLYPTGKHGRRYTAPKYAEWLKMAVPMLRTMARVKAYPVKAVLTIEGGFRSNRDVGNVGKPIIDACKKAGLIIDDSRDYIACELVEYRPVSGGYGVRVQFIPWESTS
jgi:Holliday junction resolvase RusA-like endonuclease